MEVVAVWTSAVEVEAGDLRCFGRKNREDLLGNWKWKMREGEESQVTPGT